MAILLLTDGYATESEKWRGDHDSAGPDKPFCVIQALESEVKDRTRTDGDQDNEVGWYPSVTPIASKPWALSWKEYCAREWFCISPPLPLRTVANRDPWLINTHYPCSTYIVSRILARGRLVPLMVRTGSSAPVNRLIDEPTPSAFCIRSIL